MTLKDESFDYTDKGYDEIIQFLLADGVNKDMQIWEPIRMNYWSNCLHSLKEKENLFFSENAHLWRSDEKIVAIAISEYGRGDLFIEVAEGFEFLYDQIILWVINVWSKGKEQVKILSYEDDHKKIQYLQKYQFYLSGVDEYRRYYTIDESNRSFTLPKGYKIVPFYEKPNYESRIALVRSAFNNDKYDRNNLEGIHNSKTYIPELDLGIVSPEGEYVAYCIGWVSDSNNQRGYIEPLGTHKNYRRKGFASSLIKECFFRLKKLGVKEVIINSSPEPDISNYLYDSMKPHRKRKIIEYTLQNQIENKGSL